MDGDLIVSGQFAWEGAVAMATADEDGCVVSHRYPVYRAANGVRTAYLLGLLRSRFGDFLLNEASRGSAGRNRPLNTWRLEKEKIPVPSDDLQFEVERAIDFERKLKARSAKSIALLNEFRAALITAAVTGQIDVTTWGRHGGTDPRLDRIEEEMRLMTDYVVEAPDDASEALQAAFDIGPRDENGDLIQYSELTLHFDGTVKVEIFSNEHPPPHFRITYRGDTGNFAILDCRCLNGGSRVRRYERNIHQWWKAHKQSLIQAWNERRPADCPVGPYRE